MSFVLCVNTHVSARDLQTAKTSVFVEVLKLADDLNYPLNFYGSSESKRVLRFFLAFWLNFSLIMTQSNVLKSNFQHKAENNNNINHVPMNDLFFWLRGWLRDKQKHRGSTCCQDKDAVTASDRNVCNFLLERLINANVRHAWVNETLHNEAGWIGFLSFGNFMKMNFCKIFVMTL